MRGVLSEKVTCKKSQYITYLRNQMSTTVAPSTFVKMVFQRMQSGELQQALADLSSAMSSLRVGSKNAGQIAKVCESYLSLLEEVRRVGGDVSSLDGLDSATTLSEAAEMHAGLTEIMKFVEETETSLRYIEWVTNSSSST